MGQRLVIALLMFWTLSECQGLGQTISFRHEKYPLKLNQLEALSRSEAQNR